ncbi:MAG: hypothetical protein U0790_21120 [Isosphaeraceae bacterium]
MSVSLLESMPASARISVIARWLIALLAWPAYAAAILGDEPEPGYAWKSPEARTTPGRASTFRWLSWLGTSGPRWSCLDPRGRVLDLLETSFQPVSAPGSAAIYISGARTCSGPGCGWLPGGQR